MIIGNYMLRRPKHSKIEILAPQEEEEEEEKGWWLLQGSWVY